MLTDPKAVGFEAFRTGSRRCQAVEGGGKDHAVTLRRFGKLTAGGFDRLTAGRLTTDQGGSGAATYPVPWRGPPNQLAAGKLFL